MIAPLSQGRPRPGISRKENSMRPWMPLLEKQLANEIKNWKTFTEVNDLKAR